MKKLYLVLGCVVLFTTLLWGIGTRDVYDFLDNLIATVLGVGIGIPAGLWINRSQIQEAEEREDQKHKDETDRRTRKVLTLISTELEDNIPLLSNFPANMARTDGLGYRPFKMEVWNAFSDGGELQWIQDPDTLEKLANAYHRIRILGLLQEQLFAVQRSSWNMLIHDQAMSNIRAEAREAFRGTIEAIKETITFARTKSGSPSDG